MNRISMQFQSKHKHFNSCKSQYEICGMFIPIPALSSPRKRLLHNLPFQRGIHKSPVDSSHKESAARSLMFPLLLSGQAAESRVDLPVI